MAAVTLRPLSTGEILDHAFGLFRQLFVPLVVVQVICSSVPLLMNLYVAASGTQNPLVTLVIYLVAFILGALASAATAYIISENYLGRPLGARDALARAVPRIGDVMILSLGVGFVVVIAALPALLVIGAGGAYAALGGTSGTSAVGGGVALMLVGLALLVLPFAVFSGLSIATPALVLERIPAGRAMSRSWQLTKKSRLRIIGLLFVVLVIVMIPMFGIGALAGIFGTDESRGGIVFVTAVTGVISLMITPLLYCVLTLLYYDLRVRKEGYDLEVLAAELPA
ncbi:MAG TPA: glycerophosphoryl diester phosphodiesterase membrane domain-containing protein [Gemmatimonadales bacterium]|nr:glycerophosphoryl diester phosphodiesterase membrane domain-containing protein [Gemmatimonadales bacterium]